MSEEENKTKKKAKKRPVKLTKLQTEAFEYLKLGDVYFRQGAKLGLRLYGIFDNVNSAKNGTAVLAKRTAYYGLCDKGFAVQEDIWSGLQLTRANHIRGTMGFQNYKTIRFTLSEKSLRMLRAEEFATTKKEKAA